MKPRVHVVLGKGPLRSDELATDLIAPERGAIVTFEGRVRSPNNGASVQHLDYEAYDAVARPLLERIGDEALAEHGLEAVVIAHRLGRVLPAEVAFFVAVASGHRQEAFEAAALIVDRVKAEAPIWKKEITDQRSFWSGLPEDVAQPGSSGTS